MGQAARAGLLAALAVLVLAACGTPPGGQQGAPSAPADGSLPVPGFTPGAAATSPEEIGPLRLYTTVTQDTVDAVLAAFAAAHPEVEVEVFRAPTGELNARVAAERRDGRVQADVFWLTDPLSMLQHDAEGLLASWTPANAAAIPARHRSERFWGTRLLNMLIVAREDAADPPTSWDELPEVDGGVALPDPGFAGSAFGALGYFALDEGHGMAFYERLAEAGAVQVDAPGEVINAVAEGRVAAGMTLDKPARDAAEQGSPIQLIWPEPGAIAIDSPVAVLAEAAHAEAARRFVELVLSEEGQTAVASTGWQPVRDDVAWEHDAGGAVSPDWEAAFERHAELMEQYRAIFGG